MVANLQDLVRPFAALRPAPRHAADVAAPPYDVMSSDEARDMAADRPLSFLHVSKAEIDLPPGTDVYADAVYAKAAENFTAMIEQGILVRDAKPCYYAYRMTRDDHVQTGIVIGASVKAYDENQIRKHEHTRPQKEDDRVKQIESLNAQTGPVLLAHKPHAGLAAILQRVSAARPAYEVTCAGAVHGLWVIDGDDDIAAVSAAVNGMDSLYIADGHHRSAAASRVVAARLGDSRASLEGFEAFLAVSFPADEVMILPYNRVVRSLNGLSVEDFLSALEASFDVRPVAGAVGPDSPQWFGMYLPGQWYELHLKTKPGADATAMDKLDVALLSAHLLAPVLNITDPRRDPEIDFVGGSRGLDGLQKRVDSGEMAAAFSCHPTGLDQLFDVADSGGIMPPKSTWFEPKLADGLITLVLD